MNKGDFIRALAEENGYTLTDNEMMLNTIIAVLSECIKERTEVDVRGFFHLSFKPVKGGLHKFKKDQEAKLYPAGERIVFALSKNLKQLLKKQPDT